MQFGGLSRLKEIQGDYQCCTRCTKLITLNIYLDYNWNSGQNTEGNDIRILKMGGLETKVKIWITMHDELSFGVWSCTSVWYAKPREFHPLDSGIGNRGQGQRIQDKFYTPERRGPLALCLKSQGHLWALQMATVQELHSV